MKWPCFFCFFLFLFCESGMIYTKGESLSGHCIPVQNDINDTEALFYVCCDTTVRNYIKGIYSSAGFDPNTCVSIQLRKALVSGSNFLNQVIFDGHPILSKLYMSEDDALADLTDIIIANQTNNAFTIIVDWANCPKNTDLHFSNLTWIDTDNMAVELLKRRELETTHSQSSGWPAIPSNRIRFSNRNITEKYIINNEENHILDTSSKVDEFCPGKENIVINEPTEGNYSVFETTNTMYDDINIVRKRAINPTFERVEHRNSSFVDEPDGIRTFFYLPDFLCSRTAIDVYKNGLRLKLGTDYEVYPEHDLVVFTTAPALGDDLVCDFVSKREHFYINTKFDGVSIIEDTNSPSGFKRYYLDGIDSSCYTGNNFTAKRHGFYPMQFLIEPASGANNQISIGNDTSISPDQKYLIFKHESNTVNNSTDPSRTENIINHSIGANRIISEVEMYVPDNVFDTLSNFPSEINWLTIQEYWEGRTAALVGGGYDDNTEIRLTLGMLKGMNDDSLHFELWADTIKMDTPLVIGNYAKISSVGSDTGGTYFTVPRAKWFRIHTEIWPGDEKHGRVFLSVITNLDSASPTTQTVFDKCLQTVCKRQISTEGNYDMTKTYRPVYENFSTMKLYTSKALVDSLKSTPLQVYFRNHRLDCIHAILNKE